MKKGKIFAASAACILFLIVGFFIGTTYTNLQLKGSISVEKAYKIALNDLGIDESKAQLLTADVEFENAKPVYKIEFEYSSVCFGYIITMKDGKVLKRYTSDDAAVTDDTPNDTTAQSETEPISENTSSSQSAEDTTASANVISIDTAKGIALKRAKLSADDVRFVKANLEKSHGRKVYEIEFICGIYEYEVKIDAFSGEVIKFEHEIDD